MPKDKIKDALDPGVARAMKLREFDDAVKRGLISTRARNALLVFYESKDEICAALRESSVRLMDVPGIGRKALNDIRRWCGLPVHVPKNAGSTPFAIRRAIAILRNNGYVVYLPKRRARNVDNDSGFVDT